MSAAGFDRVTPTVVIRLHPKITHAAFEGRIIDLAHLFGWRAHAERPALRQSGKWSTPIRGDAGWPDLVLVHPRSGLLIVAELKIPPDKVTAAQQEWLDALTIPGIQVHVWRPVDWPAIVEIVSFGRAVIA